MSESEQGGPDELSRLRAQAEGMRRAMASRAVIEQAVGLLIGVYGTDPETAFEHLVRLSQHHNIKLRRMAAVLVELTAEAGAATAAVVVQRLLRADPLVDLATQRNGKRGYNPTRELPGAIVEAARALIVAYDGRALESPGTGEDGEDCLHEARITLYAELVRLGWVPPMPIPAELAEQIDHRLDIGSDNT